MEWDLGYPGTQQKNACLRMKVHFIVRFLRAYRLHQLSFIFDSPYQSWVSAIPDFIISLYQTNIYLQIKVFSCIGLSHPEWWLCFLQIELTKTRLQATLLVKSPETGELFVNFDPQILTLIRETDCMAHMCLDIPPFASAIQQKRDWYKNIVHSLQVGSF